jgi:hypothetical protein
MNMTIRLPRLVNETVELSKKLNDAYSMGMTRDDIEQALDHIRYIAEHYARNTLLDIVRDEWIYLAIVLDRLQFVVFSLTALIGTLTLFVQVRRSFVSACSNDYFKVPQLFHYHRQSSTDFVRFANPNVTMNEVRRTS